MSLLGMLLHLFSFAAHVTACNTPDSNLARQASILDRDTLTREDRPGSGKALCCCSGHDEVFIHTKLLARMKLEQVRLNILREDNSLAFQANQRLEPAVYEHAISCKDTTCSVIQLQKMLSIIHKTILQNTHLRQVLISIWPNRIRAQRV